MHYKQIQSHSISPTDARWCRTAMQIVASNALDRRGSLTASQQKASNSTSCDTWKEEEERE